MLKNMNEGKYVESAVISLLIIVYILFFFILSEWLINWGSKRNLRRGQDRVSVTI